MKRINKKVPGFDEIIFLNRNKAYGAYDLRKRYKSTASWSILGGIALTSIFVTTLSFNGEKGTASPGITEVTLVMSEPVTTKYVQPPQQKPAVSIVNVIKNLKPVVTDDTSAVKNYIPTADELQKNVDNGTVAELPKTADNTETVIPADPEPLIVVQEKPEFPGGDIALLKYVSERLKYPPEASNNNIQGKVQLKFVVKSDGSVDRIQILRGVDPSIDSEAVRVVKTLPRFKPGRQGGVAVPVWFSLPVTFRLETN